MAQILANKSSLRLRLIGPMGLWTNDGQDLLPTSVKTRMLLAGIALAAPRPALRDRLATIIWPKHSPARARSAMRQEVHRLGEIIAQAGDDILKVKVDRVSFEPGRVRVDVEEVLHASTAEPAALDLMDRDLLEDLTGIEPAFDAMLRTVRERLRAHARSVAEELLAAQTSPRGVILAARRLLAIDPSHEATWRTLMRAHADLGEQWNAIKAYESCRAALADLLGLEPVKETETLLLRIRQGGLAQRPLVPSETRPKPGRAGGGAPLVGVRAFVTLGMPATFEGAGATLAEQVAAKLSAFSPFGVLPRTLDASGTPDEVLIRDALGIDFLVDGSFRRHQAGMRATIRVLDLASRTQTGASGGAQVVWSNHFDRPGVDPDRWLDGIAREAAAQISPSIVRADARHRAHVPIAEASAEDLLRRAVAMLPSVTRDNVMRSGEYIRLARDRDPRSPAALALSAVWNVLLVNQGWSPTPDETLREAGTFAERALTRKSDDPLILNLAAHAWARQPCDLTEAEALHTRALELNPNSSLGWGLAALTAAYGGNTPVAEHRFGRYKSLSPHNPFAPLLDVAAPMIQVLKGDYRAAAAAGRTTSQVSPASAQAYRGYLASLGHLGEKREAEMVLARVMSLTPGFGIDQFLLTTPMRDPKVRDIYVEGMRRAGVV